MTLEQIKQERHAFEDFMRSQNDGDRLELDEDGCYADISIEYAWSGWKARSSSELVDTLRDLQPSEMNKVTKEFLESEIVDVTYTRLTGTLTHCAITVKSGFVFTGESACVDESAYNKEIGEKIAYDNAFEKMWMPYGFWLKQTNVGLCCVNN